VGEERRMEGRKGLHHHWKSYEFFHRSSRILSSLLCDVTLTFTHNVVQITQQRRKVTDGVSVISPNNRKNLTFVGQDVVVRERTCHGRQNVLMKTLYSSGRPYTITLIRNLLLNEGNVHVCGRSGLQKFQPVLVDSV
jgi:hypothetical protein